MKEFLSQRGYAYLEVDTSKERVRLAEVQKIGDFVIPTAIIGEVVVKGYNPQKLEEALQDLKA